jgi:hypothetical protein
MECAMRSISTTSIPVPTSMRLNLNDFRPVGKLQFRFWDEGFSATGVEAGASQA